MLSQVSQPKIVMHLKILKVILAGTEIKLREDLAITQVTLKVTTEDLTIREQSTVLTRKSMRPSKAPDEDHAMVRN